MMGVVEHPIQAAIGELTNLYGVSHYPGGTLHTYLAQTPEIGQGQQVKEDNPPHWGSNPRTSVCEANALSYTTADCNKKLEINNKK